jgi:CubicO group peptidase (beta-lactamase class C family)/D-alanyl-D-alanine dipeptidase
MRIIAAVVFLLAGLLTHAGRGQPADRYAPVAAALETLIRKEMDAHRLPAVSIALVEDQRVVWSAGFGFADAGKTRPATADTVCRVGSLSKLFTCLAVLKLVEQGKLDLDAPVTQYLPELRPEDPFNGPPITLRHLMAHRAGLGREPPVGNYFEPDAPTLADTVASLNQTRLVHETGTRLKYSNAGLAVVGAVVEKVSGRPFAAAVRDTVIKPLGLTRTDFEPSVPADQRAAGLMTTLHGREFAAPTFELGMAPAAGLYSTANDLSKVVSMLFSEGQGQSGPVLRRERLAEMMTPQFQSAGRRNGAGFGLFVSEFEGHRRVGHDGAMYGFATEVAALPGPKLGAVVVASRDFANGVTASIGSNALRMMLAARDGKPLPEARPSRAEPPGWKPPSRARPAPPPEPWNGLIGEYGWDHNTLYVLERDGRLHALIEWLFSYPLTEVSPDTYRFPPHGFYSNEPVEFKRGADGRATEVVAANVRFRRRPLPGEGKPVYRIHAQRPVADLMAEARRAEPPEFRGEFARPDLVDLTRLDPTIRFDIRYAGTENFLGVPVYPTAKAYLQRPAAEAMLRAHRSLAEDGVGLLIHDGYRPWHVTKVFWDATPQAQRLFVADPAQGSRHNRGCAVDLTLYDLKSGRPVEMPSGYDEFSDRAYPGYPGGTSLQRWYRDRLRQAMEGQGFAVYEAEWWHFDYRDWKKYPVLNIPFEQLGQP